VEGTRARRDTIDAFLGTLENILDTGATFYKFRHFRFPWLVDLLMLVPVSDVVVSLPVHLVADHVSSLFETLASFRDGLDIFPGKHARAKVQVRSAPVPVVVSE
jgi:hypothetical protein